MQPTEGGHTVRLMLPSSRNSLREWEVRLGQQVIGWVRERPYRALTFYEAEAIHPTTGESLSLEMNTDLDERVEIVRRFWLDPMTSRQHLPRHLQQLHGLE